MVIKKKNWYDDEDTILYKVSKDIELYQDVLKDAKEWTIIGEGGYREALNFLDQGRNCPYCAGILKFFEYTKAGNDVVYCSDCKRRMYPADFNYVSDTVDKLYKAIPDDLVMYWDDFLRRDRKRQRLEGTVTQE